MGKAIVLAEYQGIRVSFTEEGWFNATEIADKFGKRPVDWLRLPDTEKYLEALCRQSEVRKSHFVMTRRGGDLAFQGTWLHPKLAVAFARWLDVDFAVWCDLQIDGLIHGNNNWKRLRHKSASSFKVMEDILKDVRAEIGKATLSHHYSNEARLINWALTGEFKGLNRDSLSIQEMDVLAKLEEKNTVLIGRGVKYDVRKTILEQFAIDRRTIPSDERKALQA